MAWSASGTGGLGDPVGSAVDTGLKVFGAITGYQQQQKQNERQDRLDAQAAATHQQQMQLGALHIQQANQQFQDAEAAKKYRQAIIKFQPYLESNTPPPPAVLKKLYGLDPSVKNYLDTPQYKEDAYRTIFNQDVLKQWQAGDKVAEQELLNAATVVNQERLGGGKLTQIHLMPGGKLAFQGEFPSIPAMKDGKPVLDAAGNPTYLTRGGQPTPGPTYSAPLTDGADTGPNAIVTQMTIADLFGNAQENVRIMSLLKAGLAQVDPKEFESWQKRQDVAEDRTYTEGRDTVKHKQAIEMEDRKLKGQKELHAEGLASAERVAELDRDMRWKIAEAQAALEKAKEARAAGRDMKAIEISLLTQITAMQDKLIGANTTTVAPHPYQDGKFITTTKNTDPATLASAQKSLDAMKAMLHEINPKYGVSALPVGKDAPKPQPGSGNSGKSLKPLLDPESGYWIKGD